MIGSPSAGFCFGSGLNTPLGLPVVPEEYSIGVPNNSSSIGIMGKVLIASW